MYNQLYTMSTDGANTLHSGENKSNLIFERFPAPSRIELFGSAPYGSESRQRVKDCRCYGGCYVVTMSLMDTTLALPISIFQVS